MGKRAGLSGNLSPSVTAPLLLIGRLLCQRAAMIAPGDGGAFLMLGGSDILCRKGVGSISLAPLGRLLRRVLVFLRRDQTERIGGAPAV